MTKLIAIRVKEENARKLYELAAREHRNPGQQLDVIIEAWDAADRNAVGGSPDTSDRALVQG